MIKTNKTMRAGVIFAIVALITLVGISGTFAKYVSQTSASDTARVAKWGINYSDSVTFNLFSQFYKNGEAVATATGADVAGSGASNNHVIAPGTSNSVTISLAAASGAAPEVAYHLGVTDFIVADASPAGFMAALDALGAAGHFKWTLENTVTNAASTYTKIADLVAAVKAIGKDYAPGEAPSNDSGQIIIGWEWLLEGGSTPEEKATWNALDTQYGNAIAAATISYATFTISVGANQIQNAS